MPSAYRNSYTVTDPKTGRRVKKKTKTWNVQVRDMSGRPKVLTGYPDRTSALRAGLDFEERERDKARGIIGPYDEHLERPLLEHLGDYKAFMRAKGNTRKYYRYVHNTVQRALKECGFVFWRDLSPSQLVSYLGGLREMGRVANTHNSHLTAVKGFFAWLVKDRRAPENPITHLSKVPVDDDRAVIRRALTDKEFGRLVSVAEPEHADIYVFTAYTGLRAEEVGLVTRDRITFEPEATIRAGGLSKKRHQRDILPLHPAVVERIRPWAEKLLPRARLWPGNWYKRAAEMLQEDLTAAKIPYKDELGHVFDFHALRGQFATSLARNDVPLQEAQVLLRHSDPRLTANVYTHLTLRDHMKAIKKLPGVQPVEEGPEDCRLATGMGENLEGNLEGGPVYSGHSVTSADTQSGVECQRLEEAETPIKTGQIVVSQGTKNWQAKRDLNPQPADLETCRAVFARFWAGDVSGWYFGNCVRDTQLSFTVRKTTFPLAPQPFPTHPGIL